jgi:HD-GYP domain-containing protein (c-di-GMP phosphodiesterase class II)
MAKAVAIDKDLLRSLLVIGDLIEARDPYTGGHVWRVSQIAKLLALKYGLAKDAAVQVSLGGYLHDLGKIGIPDSILRKKDKLDEAEFDTIKTHPSIGQRLISEHPLGALVLDMILHHHERLDGQGYPDGLSGGAITLNAGLISLADAFDALTSTRPYHKARTIPEALSILKDAGGSQFDPQLLTALEALSLGPDLAHVVGHSDEGIPLIECPACSSVLTVLRLTRDGDVVFCRTCTGKMIMHKNAESFDAEFTGTTGAPRDLQPAANLEVIKDFVAGVPKKLSI